MGRFRDVELDQLELSGDRLSLRRWLPHDAARVHAIMQDRSMYEFLALPDPYTNSAAAEFVATLGQEGRDDGSGIGSAVVERATGRIVGSAALRLRAGGAIGYWVAPDARGHGYAAEITRTLVACGFELGLPRVQLECDVGNLASARTALAAGFAFEGVDRDAITVAGGADRLPAQHDLARFSRLPADSGASTPYAFPPLPQRGLTDGVIMLRALVPGDAPEFAETDDELTLANGFGGPAHSARDYERTTARAGLDWLVGTRAMFAIVDVATGALAGSMTLRQAGPPQIGGIGYAAHPLFRGRGLTTRALRLLVPWAFEHADFARLELGAKTGNVASQRTALAAGFQPDGIRRNRLRYPDGTFSDEARFALVNPGHR